MTSCIAYEPAQLIPEITLSTEEVSFVEANHTDLVVDFGIETSANESDSLLNLEVLPGVRVRSVALNGPADSAGIQAGDVILFINNLPTNEPDAVLAIQTQTQLESYIFQIQRNTTVFEVTLYGRTITAAQEARELYRLDPIATRASYRTELATIRQQEQVAAARIIEIFPNSPLRAAGLKANDRILAVDGEFINSAQDFISKVNQEFELGDTLEITAHVDGKIEKRSLKLWSPRRRISRISMRPFFHFDSSISPPSKNFSILDLWLFAVYSYSKIENENSHDILGIFNITSDYGELTEVQD
jgi:serine protease Do